jgi:hypothetical protein
MMTIRDRFLANFNPLSFFADARFYDIYSNKEKKLICAYLNSTLANFLIEILSRSYGGGGGPIDVKVYEVESLPIIDLSRIGNTQKIQLEKAFDQISHCNALSIFSEIGTFTSRNIHLDSVQSDRRKIDRIIMENLGLNKEEQLEVYKAVIDLVKSRLDRAKSVSKKNKTKEGIDLEKLTQTVMQKIGSETLGKFYKEKILPQKHYFKKLPPKGKNIRIDQTLMEWLLISDKKHISCTSDGQARYLKVWLEAGLEEVATPNEENYLKLILPELEELFEKTKNIIDSFVFSIVDQKTRQRVLQRLWQEVVR